MSGVFLQAAGILIREGLEAILVIAALAVYLIKVGANARLPALYGGAGVAVLASIGTAWVFERFFGGAHDDLMEGVIILVAAALMLYVSGWPLVPLVLWRQPAYLVDDLYGLNLLAADG
jgi:high-affinity iron transporter